MIDSYSVLFSSPTK